MPPRQLPGNKQRRPGPDDPHWKIPVTEWPLVLERIDQSETLRKVAGEYGLSYEAIRRVERQLYLITGALETCRCLQMSHQITFTKTFATVF